MGILVVFQMIYDGSDYLATNVSLHIVTLRVRQQIVLGTLTDPFVTFFLFLTVKKRKRGYNGTEMEVAKLN